MVAGLYSRVKACDVFTTTLNSIYKEFKFAVNPRKKYAKIHDLFAHIPETNSTYDTHTVMMKHFTEGGCVETRFEEKEALMADMKHLREQCERDGYDNDTGAGAMLSLERSRLFHILCTAF